MPITFKCEFCGKTTSQSPSKYAKAQNHFCSKECKLAWKKLRYVTTECAHCGKPKTITLSKFERSENHFCTPECKKIYQIGKLKTEHTFYPCDNCGKILDLTPWEINSSETHFCDQQCNGKWKEINFRGENGPGYIHGKNCRRIQICEVCGKEFETQFATQKYCSNKCSADVRRGEVYIINCLACGKQIITTSETQKYCSWECYKEHYRGDGHHSYKHGNGYERQGFHKEYIEWRVSVFERDDYTCQVCHDNSGGNLNAHHIKTWSKYPEYRYDISNGITLCVDCHKKTWQHEEEFEERFLDILRRKIDVSCPI